jgi:hypothetical protein
MRRLGAHHNVPARPWSSKLRIGRHAQAGSPVPWLAVIEYSLRAMIALMAPFWATALAVLGGTQIVANAGVPIEGKWRLSLAKSSFASSDPRVKRATRSIKQIRGAAAVRWEFFWANGERQIGEYTAKCDGRIYQVATFPPGVDAVACAPILPFGERGNQYQDGTLVETYEQSISANGRVLTLKFFAIPPDYTHPKRILVYERH